MRGSPWTETDDAVLRKWHGLGYCDREIANKMGRDKSTVGNKRRELLLGAVRCPGGAQPGAFGRKDFHAWTPDDTAKLRELHKKLMTDAEIAAVTGWKRNTIADRRKKLGLPSHYKRCKDQRAAQNIGKQYRRGNGKPGVHIDRKPYTGPPPMGCKYPHGEGESLKWCNAERQPGRPYCQHHMGICYLRASAAQ